MTQEIKKDNAEPVSVPQESPQAPAAADTGLPAANCGHCEECPHNTPEGCAQGCDGGDNCVCRQLSQTEGGTDTDVPDGEAAHGGKPGCAPLCHNPYADRDPLELRGCGGQPVRAKLHATNYLEDIPGGMADDEMVEVQFKNTRKGFYLNSAHLPLKIGDMVAVEALPGHDIGRVSMTGSLVRLQMRKANVRAGAETRRVFRIAKGNDLERFHNATAREQDTMIRARKIASSLQLDMKIGDVEYQGDGNKAIFYYIAEQRVDFRQLIKILAETFKVRIEMRQIGARQEAGRIGGIGPCGQPLCCSTWMRNFVSVSTAAARFQDLSLNPQKLAGQCAKLKCCLNFEVDTYMEAGKLLPPRETHLETADATYYYFKADILKREITYSTDRNIPANLVTLTADEAFAIIDLNTRGEKPLKLKDDTEQKKEKERQAAAMDLANQDSLTRFDRKKRNGRKTEGPRRRTEDGTQEARRKPQYGQPKPQDDDNKPQNGHPRGERRPQDGQGRPQNGQQRRDPRQRPQGNQRPQNGSPKPQGTPRQPSSPKPQDNPNQEPPIRERRAKTDRFPNGNS